MFRKANGMLRLGMASRASQDMSSLVAIADDRKSPALGADTLLLILRLDSAAGATDRQAASFERLRSLVRSSAGVTLGTRFKTRALLALAEARLRARDPVGAEPWLREALALQRLDDGSLAKTTLAALTKTLLGVSLLQRGQADEALRSLSAAHQDQSTLVGPEDPTTCLLSLNMAMALERLGRPEEALSVVTHAQHALRKAMGAGAPTYLRTQALRDRLEHAVALRAPVVQGTRVKPAVTPGKQLPIDFFS
jgi:tetratricopeptide (TPR) repeat protein